MQKSNYIYSFATVMNNLTRPQKIFDLHQAENVATDRDYIEVYFNCCFYEVFPFPNNDKWASNLDGTEIKEIFTLLGISVFDKYLLQKFSDRRNSNAEVFHSGTDERVFAYFDLQNDPEDDYDTFFFGLSFKTEDEPVILPKLIALYRQLLNSSPLTYDLNKKGLYHKVFRSNFSFYKNNYNPYGRLLQHHGLKR